MGVCEREALPRNDSDGKVESGTGPEHERPRGVWSRVGESSTGTRSDQSGQGDLPRALNAKRLAKLGIERVILGDDAKYGM